MKKESFDEMMREMRQLYLQALPERIAHLQRLSQNLKWDDLGNEFHKIKGTGTTYGCPEITEICETMETICRSSHRRPEHLTAAVELLNYVLQAYISDKPVELRNQPRASTLWPRGGTP